VALELRVEVSGDAYDEELDEARRMLLADLAEADVGDARPAPGGEAPQDSKGFDLATLGDLLVTVADAPEALRKLVGAIRDWAGRNRDGYRVRIVLGGDELVVDRVSAQTQQRLIEAFLSAHSGGAAPEPAQPLEADPAARQAGSPTALPSPQPAPLPGSPSLRPPSLEAGHG
jgi:hypothetical protein